MKGAKIPVYLAALSQQSISVAKKNKKIPMCSFKIFQQKFWKTKKCKILYLFIINKKIIYFLVSVLSFRFLLFCFVIWSFFWYFFLCFVSSRKIGSFLAFTLCPTSRLMAEKHRCWILKIPRLWSFTGQKKNNRSQKFQQNESTSWFQRDVKISFRWRLHQYWKSCKTKMFSNDNLSKSIPSST